MKSQATTAFKIGTVTFILKEKRDVKPRIYMMPQGETILENLKQRRSRPVAEFKILAHSVINSTPAVGASLSWSQKAGCSCGCSPAFIVDSGVDYKYDIFIGVVMEGK